MNRKRRQQRRAYPLKLTSYIEDKEYEMNPLEEVYGQIIDDLEEAEACLKQTEPVSIYHADLTATYLAYEPRIPLYAGLQERPEICRGCP